MKHASPITCGTSGVDSKFMVCETRRRHYVALSGETAKFREKKPVTLSKIKRNLLKT
jgi:hypothetical protein